MKPVTKYRNIPLFYPYVSKSMKQAALKAMGEKMITQGETVSDFEKKLSSALSIKYPVAVNSCSSALELAYHLMDFKPGDEVISPVFTCSITTLALLRRGVKVIFADVKENMMLDWDHAERKITSKTKAIVDVHLFNQLNETRDLQIPVIGDAAQYLGKTRGEIFTTYSFQATKAITTVDGGILTCARIDDYKRAKLLRWYGIDRETGKDNIDVDILEAGYKYHMNNVTAAIGLSALSHLPKIRSKLKTLENYYHQALKGNPGLKLMGGSPFLVHTRERSKLRKFLVKSGIETGLVHRRNDAYTVFGGKRLNLPCMNRLESTYLLLPCRGNMSLRDVEFICREIKRYFK